jgi:hypothetical protein
MPTTTGVCCANKPSTGIKSDTNTECVRLEGPVIQDTNTINSDTPPRIQMLPFTATKPKVRVRTQGLTSTQ